MSCAVNAGMSSVEPEDMKIKTCMNTYTHMRRMNELTKERNSFVGPLAWHN